MKHQYHNVHFLHHLPHTMNVHERKNSQRAEKASKYPHLQEYFYIDCNNPHPFHNFHSNLQYDRINQPSAHTPISLLHPSNHIPLSQQMQLSV